MSSSDPAGGGRRFLLLALASGLLDPGGGQVIMVDKGFEFFDNLMGIGERAKRRGVRVRDNLNKKESQTDV